MVLVKRITKVIFGLSVLGLLFLSLFKTPLPKVSEISNVIKDYDPLQTTIDNNSYVTNFKSQKYNIIPLYDYEIYGLVVSEYDSGDWLDVTHKKDPAQTKDLCLVWGENLKNGSYREVKYKHGEFTCFYSWKNKLQNKFTSTQLSNNHLIPANEILAKLIKKSAVGDQVYIKGQLINYEILDSDGNKIASRNTSTVREDNSCEIIYVTDFKVIKKWGGYFKEIRNWSLFTIFISGGMGLIFTLFL